MGVMDKQIQFLLSPEFACCSLSGESEKRFYYQHQDIFLRSQGQCRVEGEAIEGEEEEKGKQERRRNRLEDGVVVASTLPVHIRVIVRTPLSCYLGWLRRSGRNVKSMGCQNVHMCNLRSSSSGSSPIGPQ